MTNSDMINRSDPPDPLDELEFLKQVASVLSAIGENAQRNFMMHERDALTAAERAAARWEERRQAQLARCADAGACPDRRCRRTKHCAALRWISAKARTAHARLAAERAKWPAPPAAETAVPDANKDKGRTGVRPA
jgi:hypothetical protein